MKTLGIIVLGVIVVGLGWYIYSSKYAIAPTTNNIEGGEMEGGEMMDEGDTMMEDKGMMKKEVLIEMTPAGFSPSNVTIKVGDTVKFVNKDTRGRWPASGMHPSHLICPGFDSLGLIAPGEAYSHTFTEAKECPMHDHKISGLFGKIMVQ